MSEGEPITTVPPAASDAEQYDVVIPRLELVGNEASPDSDDGDIDDGRKADFLRIGKLRNLIMQLEGSKDPTDFTFARLRRARRDLRNLTQLHGLPEKLPTIRKAKLKSMPRNLSPIAQLCANYRARLKSCAVYDLSERVQLFYEMLGELQSEELTEKNICKLLSVWRPGHNLEPIPQQSAYQPFRQSKVAPHDMESYKELARSILQLIQDDRPIHDILMEMDLQTDQLPQHATYTTHGDYNGMRPTTDQYDKNDPFYRGVESGFQVFTLVDSDLE